MTPLSSSSSRGEAHRAHVPHEENEPELVLLVCAPLSAETVTAARRRQTTAHDDTIVRTKQRNEDEREEEKKKKKQARLFFVFVATTIVIAASNKTRGARDSFSRHKHAHTHARARNQALVRVCTRKSEEARDEDLKKKGDIFQKGFVV